MERGFPPRTDTAIAPAAIFPLYETRSRERLNEGDHPYLEHKVSCHTKLRLRKFFAISLNDSLDNSS